MSRFWRIVRRKQEHLTVVNTMTIIREKAAIIATETMAIMELLMMLLVQVNQKWNYVKTQKERNSTKISNLVMQDWSIKIRARLSS